MQHVEKTIEVEAPITTVYNQWTQFEEFPRFMEGVESVQQLDDKRLRWRAEIGGKTVEWDAEIFEQIPDRRIAWRSINGIMNSGMVNFEPLSETCTRVCLKVNYQPEGAVEKLASDIQIPKGLAEYGVRPSHIPRVIDEAMKSGNVAVNPRPTSKEQLTAVLEQSL